MSGAELRAAARARDALALLAFRHTADVALFGALRWIPAPLLLRVRFAPGRRPRKDPRDVDGQRLIEQLEAHAAKVGG